MNNTKAPARVKLPSTWRRQTTNSSTVDTKYIDCAEVTKSCGKKEKKEQSKGERGLEVAIGLWFQQPGPGGPVGSSRSLGHP